MRLPTANRAASGPTLTIRAVSDGFSRMRPRTSTSTGSAAGVGWVREMERFKPSFRAMTRIDAGVNPRAKDRRRRKPQSRRGIALLKGFSGGEPASGTRRQRSPETPENPHPAWILGECQKSRTVSRDFDTPLEGRSDRAPWCFRLFAIAAARPTAPASRARCRGPSRWPGRRGGGSATVSSPGARKSPSTGRVPAAVPSVRQIASRQRKKRCPAKAVRSRAPTMGSPSGPGIESCPGRGAVALPKDIVLERSIEETSPTRAASPSG